ncbi:MAG TPA: hypothetical protein VFN24_02455 [Microbacterium sp.]|nr:hypothetical protein [Microbacterium sp.]
MATDLIPSTDAGGRADASRFALHRVNSIEWDIVDTTVPAASAAHIIAYIYKYDRLEFGVTWMRGFDLRAEYSSPREALDDVSHAWAPTRRAVPPVMIPHLPPVTTPG